MHRMAPLVDTVNMPQPHTSNTARPYHHGGLHDSLVDAGLALARVGGPGAVVLRAVSRQAGVSHNAAYRHFADHEELVAAVAERCMAELAGLMHRRLAEVDVPGQVARARAELTAVGRAYIEFARAEPGWFRTAFTGAVAPTGANTAAPDEPPSMSPALADPYQLLSRCLDALVEVGELDPQRRPGAEVAAWSMVHGLSHLMAQGPLSQLPPDAAELAIGKALDVVQRGL
jgi:AcrR family transcriptional regulator